MATTPSLDLVRLPLRDIELEKEVPSPSAFLTDIGSTVPQAMLSKDSSNGNSVASTEENSDSDESSESDSESEKNEEGSSLLGKRRRTQPVKFSEEYTPDSKRVRKSPQKAASTGRRRTRQKKATDGTSTPSIQRIPDPRVIKRGTRCRQCEACKREDCGKCVY